MLRMCLASAEAGPKLNNDPDSLLPSTAILPGIDTGESMGRRVVRYFPAASPEREKLHADTDPMFFIYSAITV